MAVLIGAGITAAAALIGTGVSIWSQSRALKQAQKEAKRTERLNIKFAEEESVREERRFARTMKLEEEALETQQAGQRFNQTQTILGNLTNMLNSNRAARNTFMQLQKQRA